MKEAIRQAKKAWKIEEVPIGCVIVYQGKIIGRGYNRRTTDKNPLAHAEISAIKKASKVMGDWRLEECTLYVTLEPCQMCSGAIVQARIPRVVVGCMNPKAGCAGSILNLLQVEAFNHQAELTTGVLEEECSQMMKSFFKELRKKQKMKKKEQESANMPEPVKGRLFCMKKATEAKSVAFVISFFCALCVELKPTKRYSGCKLNPGYLTAPERFCLVLLRSRPDTVHRVPPRKTQISTPQTRGSFDK